jgi:release factor glutamine methyltransferase
MRTPALTPAQAAEFEALLARRAAREPLSHILGYREFYGRNFKVTRAVLDPRPDSETLIEAVLKSTTHHPPLTLLDIGTGSGCLLLTLLAELPHATGVGVDISPDALAIAKENAAHLGLTDRVQWVQADMKTLALQGRFDLIISNPPYIETAEIATLAPEVAQFEPKIALDGGKDGLDCYRKLANEVARLLAPQGSVALEIGHKQAGDVTRLLEASGFFCEAIIQDLGGHDRVIIAKHATHNMQD